MSFILDALKKSENERQQQAPPEFATVPADPDSPRAPRWLWVLGGLLLVNLVVVVALLTRDATPSIPSAPIDATQAVETATAPRPVAAPAPRPVDAFSERLEEARRNLTPRTADGAGSATDAPARVSPVRSEPPPAAASAASLALLPSLDELRLNGDVDLPAMHLDIHVWSDSASDRFVFINMDKYRERDTMSSGPVVAEITRDGVVLEYRGRRFMLPRD